MRHFHDNILIKSFLFPYFYFSDAHLNLTNVSQQDLVKDYCKNIYFVCGNDGFVCNGNINALVYTHMNTHRMMHHYNHA